ncbi:hypothetical protein VM57_19545 [Stenotrophomonas maltophilia]|uniref:Uncharacterized protein n=1 Tax=Stenotrophomonas maltophilia TaxID=40324 RepID=A0A0F5ZN95_STEMA|nr:hypothetical protein VM57_19545 [Stenotrophomonas maltophilia]
MTTRAVHELGAPLQQGENDACFGDQHGKYHEHAVADSESHPGTDASPQARSRQGQCHEDQQRTLHAVAQAMDKNQAADRHQRRR